MQKNNLIRFVQSLILLPFVAGSLSLGTGPEHVALGTRETVFTKQQNTEAQGLLAFNQALDQRALVLDKKAEAIDNYFRSRGMPLLGLGMKMVLEAEKNELDWRLLAAIAVRESTGGKFACKKARYNSFGWGSCKINFDSNEEAIETVARNLAGNNPNTAKHYENKDIKEILRAYNPPSIVPRYAEQVIYIMDEIGEEEVFLSISA